MRDLDHRIGDAVERRRLPGYVGVVGIDADGVIRYASPDLEDRVGISERDAVGRSFADFVDAEELPQLLESFTGVSERAGHHQSLGITVQDLDGERRRYDIVAENCLDELDIGLILFNLADASDRVRSVHLFDLQSEVVQRLALGATAAETLKPVLEFLVGALPGVAAAAYLLDDLVAGRGTVSLGLAAEHTDRIAAVIRDHTDTPGAMAIDGHEVIVAANLRKPRWSTIESVVGEFGAAVWSVPIRHGRDGEIYGLFEVYCPHAAHPRDSDWVTLRLVSRLAATGIERLHMQQRLIDAAELDSLTSTPNRRALSMLLDELVSAGGEGRPVCFIDLDRLKVVNDGLGHEAGDQLIRASARRLVEAVGTSGTVGRFGGDEFVAIGTETSVGAEELARRCLEAFDAPVLVAGRRWRITASVGVVQIDGHTTAGEVLRDADAAMYEAKRTGRNRYHLFDTVTRDAVVRRMQLEQQIARAIDHDEIEPFFQPIVRCSDWSLSGLEALARWPNSGEPWVSPADFVPLLEELGLIDLIGTRMIDRALTMIERLRDGHGSRLVGECQVGVNVSPLQLLSTDLFVALEMAARRGRPVEQLCLEMTEQHMIDDSEETLRALDRLVDLGVHLAVDDFGTGYSSLGSLHRMPATTLKLDRHLVEHVDTAPGASVVAAVVGVAKAYGMLTVAEGVEYPWQATSLASLGVDRLQGYLFARPEPADRMFARLERAWPWDVTGADLSAD